jgi:purine nucleoside phosphorylase
MHELYDQIEQAAAAIRHAWPETPHAGIILGTGLGGLTEEIEVAAILDYEAIPGFLKPTATRANVAPNRPVPMMRKSYFMLRGPDIARSGRRSSAGATWLG